ncbi:MAG: hypothetical protein AAB326_03880, partial [Pseudomonadota bacterium]
KLLRLENFISAFPNLIEKLDTIISPSITDKYPSNIIVPIKMQDAALADRFLERKKRKKTFILGKRKAEKISSSI